MRAPHPGAGSDAAATAPRPLAPTGISGLDDILRGGLPRNRLYLIQGHPGTGKTTLALQFLIEGARTGEPVLLVSLSETEEELRGVAASHGWDLEGVQVREHAAVDELLASHDSQTIFRPGEVEFPRTMRRLLELIDQVRPRRLVIDSLSELRLMASDALRYRRQVLALKGHFASRDCTVLLIDDRTSEGGDLQLRSLAHGVIELDVRSVEFGAMRRWLQVAKLRGVSFRDGRHDYAIRKGGLQIFPRLVAAEHREERAEERASSLLLSGMTELDALLGGGIPRGFAVVLLGPAGVGKSTLAYQYVLAAAERGERSAIFLFDERPSTALSNAVGRKLQPHVADGTVLIQQVDPAELSPGEFTYAIRSALEERELGLVLIDGLDGLLQSMPGEKQLFLHVHELSSFLGERGVTTFMTKAQAGMVGRESETGVNLTYLADAALLFRYFEHDGAIRQAISVFKRRGGSHERTIRELRIEPEGLWIGPLLRGFHGVLTGVPTFLGGELGRKAP